MKKLLILAIVALFAANAYSAGSVTGKVERVRVDGNGTAMVIFDKPLGGEPAGCSNKFYGNALAVDARTDGGKAVLSMVIAAKLSGSTVQAYGLGTCGIYGGSTVETWNHGGLL
ncbi:hypothetical protein [Microbulbifer spongiae]|uniref:Uncharacterized protein n=1 Tax=Microbulbifer spongiae TaxID=2944933 RepID=A0ABY9EAL4_9GAMM|nr:hypothetical protein [Microbulbifer sp. MI-G]WKD48410.1 hypothetical protein M8T91_10755 [Microbulbifer sp. MI-G]